MGSYKEDIAQPYGSVTIKVEYLSNWEGFIYYNSSFIRYFLFAIVMALVFGLSLPFIHAQLGSLHLKDKIKHMISPALKGTAYSLLTAGGLACLIHLFSYYSNYSGVTATYDSNYSDEALMKNNDGRSGLAFLFAGIFIIMTGIKQAFKVN